jgi:hypothetical protein
MTHSTHRRMADLSRLPAKLGIVGGTVVSLAGWLLAVGALLGIASSLPALGWQQVAHLIVLGGAPQAAMLATRRVRRSRRILADMTQPLMERRLHGNLDAISDGEGRLLRPIGATAADIAGRTAILLGELITIPNVRVFNGVRTDSGQTPPVAHAVAAGRSVTLVESVAWPSGNYTTDGSGRISCDGQYIGQSTEQLEAAVRHWRRVLPRGHRVSAVVVVHRTTVGAYTLPVTGARDITWVDANGVLRLIHQRLGRPRYVSTHAIAALVVATRAA